MPRFYLLSRSLSSLPFPYLPSPTAAALPLEREREREKGEFCLVRAVGKVEQENEEEKGLLLECF